MFSPFIIVSLWFYNYLTGLAQNHDTNLIHFLCPWAYAGKLYLSTHHSSKKRLTSRLVELCRKIALTDPHFSKKQGPEKPFFWTDPSGFKKELTYFQMGTVTYFSRINPRPQLDRKNK